MRPSVLALALAAGLASAAAAAQPRWGAAYHRPCRSPAGLAPTLELSGDTYRWCGGTFAVDGRFLGPHAWRDPAEAPRAAPPDARPLPAAPARDALLRRAVAVSRDGRLALVPAPGAVVLYDVEARRELREVYTGPLLAAVAADDGARFLVASRDGDDGGWVLTDFGAEDEPRTARHRLAGIRRLWLSPSGRALAWVGADRVVALAAAGGRRVATHRAPAALTDVAPNAALDRVACRSGRAVSVLALEGGRLRVALRLPDTAASALADDGRALLVHASDAMLTAYREGVEAPALPPPPDLRPPPGWRPVEDAYDWWVAYQPDDGYPHGARLGDAHGLVAAWRAEAGAASAEVYASDPAELAEARDDRRAWARAVLARHGQNNAGGGRPTLDALYVHDVRVWRLPDRGRAMTWWQHAANHPAGLAYRNHVLVFERAPWLYRVEVHLPDRPCPATGDAPTLCTEEGQRAVLRALLDAAPAAPAAPARRE